MVFKIQPSSSFRVFKNRAEFAALESIQLPSQKALQHFILIQFLYFAAAV
jgi:hypothetical protein